MGPLNVKPVSPLALRMHALGRVYGTCLGHRVWCARPDIHFAFHFVVILPASFFRDLDKISNDDNSKVQ